MSDKPEFTTINLKKAFVRKTDINTPEGNPIFGFRVIGIEIDDEAAGPFIVLTQLGDNANADLQRITINFDEIVPLFDEIKKMIKEVEANGWE